MNGAGGNVAERAQKRPDYLTWNEYFMSVALLSAQRSKDPNSQVHGVHTRSVRKMASCNRRLAVVYFV